MKRRKKSEHFRLTPVLTTPGGNSHIHSPLELQQLRKAWPRLQLPYINTWAPVTRNKDTNLHTLTSKSKPYKQASTHIS